MHCIHEIFLVVAFGYGGTVESVAMLDGVAEVKAADHGVVDPAFAEVCQTYLASVGGLGEVLFKVF